MAAALALSLQERVLLSDIFGEYIPDYCCVQLSLKDYTYTPYNSNKQQENTIADNVFAGMPPEGLFCKTDVVCGDEISP